MNGQCKIINVLMYKNFMNNSMIIILIALNEQRLLSCLNYKYLLTIIITIIIKP